MISERLKKLRVTGFEKDKNEVGERLYISPEVPGPVQIYDNYLSIAINSIPYDIQSRTRLSDFPFTFHFHALEKEMVTHSSILA